MERPRAPSWPSHRRGAVVVVGLMSLIVLPVLGYAQSESAPTSKPTSRVSKDIPKKEFPREDVSVQLAAVEKKLDRILVNQETILQKLDAMMEELRIVKIRATR